MAGKTGVYVFIGILCLCFLSICISISLISTGTSFAATILARMMALFGVASLSDQAKTVCPTIQGKLTDEEAIEYVNGKKKCPDVTITKTVTSGEVPPTSGATTTYSWASGTSGTRSGL